MSIRGSFRLLVVDDEPGIRRNLARVLRERGFTTIEAPDGTVASELIRNSQLPFDLVITDIIMPGIDGIQLAELTASLSPTTRILLISAWVPDPRRPGATRLPFLLKPFDLTTFLNKVREMLDSWTPPESFPPAGVPAPKQ